MGTALVGGISKCWCHFRARNQGNIFLASIIEFFSIFDLANNKSCIPMGGGAHGNHVILRPGCGQYNYLGVLLDECLNLNANFNQIFKKYSYKIVQCGKIKRYIAIDTRILIYKQTILPLVEYVSFMLYLNSNQEVDKLQKLQNRCLRMCLNINNPRDMSVNMLHSNYVI